jgi:large repetitive protein
MISAAAIDAWAVDALGLPYNDPNPGVDTFPEAGPPAAPTSLVATPGDGQASIAFTASVAYKFPVLGYEYRVGSGAWTAGGTTSPVVVTGLANDVEVSITLRATSTVGNSAASAPVLVTPVGAPEAPTDLVATPGDTEVSIAFTEAVDNGSAVTDYEYAVDGGEWTSAATATSPVVVTGLTNDVEVSIALRAVNSIGAGDASDPVTATPTGT